MTDSTGNGKGLKPLVFWPPFILILGVVALSQFSYETFANVMNGLSVWIFTNFAWAFQIVSLGLVILCVALYFSPFGKVVIGGTKAKRILKPFNWFAVTLCIGIAVGILFWAAGEPMMHFNSPPPSLGIEPNSAEAAKFAMSTMYLHWTFTPYAIYTIPTVIFAFAYYNMRKPYCIGSTLYPLFGERSVGSIGQIVDAVCVFALMSGMATSLGAGVLSIGGGLDHLFGIQPGPLVWLIITGIIVATFIASAISGITKGVKWLCDINTKVFFGLVIFIAVFGPTIYSLNLGTDALGSYLGNFLEKSLFTGVAANDQWPLWWSILYWVVWMAWAPLTAVFLGQISAGYTVRQVILCNFVAPSLFGIVWMTIFSGAAIHMEWVGKLGLAAIVMEKGPEAATYFFLGNYPIPLVTCSLFVLTMYLSYVTGADAMTTAVGGLCSHGISPDSPEPKIWLKVVWGVLLGAVAWIMICFRGIDGAKMVSFLGGLLALFLLSLMVASLVKVALKPKKYDYYQEDYAADGTYLPQAEGGRDDLTSDITNTHTV